MSIDNALWVRVSRISSLVGHGRFALRNSCLTRSLRIDDRSCCRDKGILLTGPAASDATSRLLLVLHSFPQMPSRQVRPAFVLSGAFTVPSSIPLETTFNSSSVNSVLRSLSVFLSILRSSSPPQWTYMISVTTKPAATSGVEPTRLLVPKGEVKVHSKTFSPGAGEG
jgi:hypothetical protein